MSIQQPPFLYLPACTSASGGSLEGVTACNLFNSLCIPINRLELLPPWREKNNKYWRMSSIPSKVRFWTARWQSRVCYRKHPALTKPEWKYYSLPKMTILWSHLTGCNQFPSFTCLVSFTNQTTFHWNSQIFFWKIVFFTTTSEGYKKKLRQAVLVGFPIR